MHTLLRIVVLPCGKKQLILDTCSMRKRESCDRVFKSLRCKSLFSCCAIVTLLSLRRIWLRWGERKKIYCKASRNDMCWIFGGGERERTLRCWNFMSSCKRTVGHEEKQQILCPMLMKMEPTSAATVGHRCNNSRTLLVRLSSTTFWDTVQTMGKGRWSNLVLFISLVWSLCRDCVVMFHGTWNAWGHHQKLYADIYSKMLNLAVNKVTGEWGRLFHSKRRKRR